MYILKPSCSSCLYTVVPLDMLGFVLVDDVVSGAV